ncbi:hypothetical protein GG804_22365 [Sphingomonas histidinilytica]|uniref:chaperone modulator CbpM n=1 Tax=Sphingomonadales TaxID=204457 RepID=UPI0007702B53|nr:MULTISPECIES: chaperone modulator CbpM [Sphingomonadaceae]AMK23071.1 hypothetical protein K426_10645 [Sphingobium sp. TKS]MBO9379521.1 hypothetical protein [Rhizorhabdus histidinilytica]MCF8707813.1 chaperone modulator CbpM [Rhizorhapis sp. SPR117]
MIDLDEFLARSGIDLRSLELWIEREWIIAEQRSATIILSDMDAARARLIRDLKHDFGVNDEGIDIVLHLVDQLHGLRQVVAEARAQAEAQPRRGVRRSRGPRSAPPRPPRKKS